MYDSQYHIQPVMVARRRLTDQERHLAVARIRAGSTQCDVAGELGVSQSVISRLVHIYLGTPEVLVNDPEVVLHVVQHVTMISTCGLTLSGTGFDCSRAAITIERGQRYQSVQANHSEPTSSPWTTR